MRFAITRLVHEALELPAARSTARCARRAGATPQAAWALDTLGIFGAITEVSAIKVIAPNVLQMVTDAAIQIHGGEGVSDPELNMLMAMARVLRLADDPDEVHRGVVARLEVKKYV